MNNKELKQLYANNLISIKEFIKGLSLLEAQSPLALNFIEALQMKALNRTTQATQINQNQNKTKDGTK
jgi:hypothetical protein